MIWNIVSDSSCDLQSRDFSSDRVRFELVPLRIQVGEREFVDNDDLVVPDLLAAMAEEKSASSTACPSPEAFARAFAAGDRTVCFTISANLSGTYNAAVLGREMVNLGAFSSPHRDRGAGVCPEQCVLLDDSPSNCATARKSGMSTVGVFDPFYAERQEELKSVSTRYVRSLEELLEG